MARWMLPASFGFIRQLMPGVCDCCFTWTMTVDVSSVVVDPEGVRGDQSNARLTPNFIFRNFEFD